MKRPLLGVAIAVALLWYLIERAGFTALVATIAQVRLPLLGASLLVLLLEIYVKASRWALATRVAVGRPVRGAFSATLIGFAGNMVLPARMGELARAHVMSRNNAVARSLALTTAGVTQLFDLLVLGVYFLVASAWLTSELLVDQRLLALLVGGVLAVLLTLLVAHRRSEALVVGFRAAAWWIPERLRERLESYARHFTSGLSLLGSRRAVAGVLAYTVAVWLLETLSLALALHACRIPFDPLIPALVTAVLNLAFAFPVTPGNVGPHQFLCVLVLGLFGVSQVDALSFSIVSQGANTVLLLLLGAFCFHREAVSIGLLRGEGANGMQDATPAASEDGGRADGLLR